MKSKESKPVISVRIPDGVLEEIDIWISQQPVKVSRSAAIVYLITKGLRSEDVIVKE